jgi:glycosyltransferase involved in cell wall biosynthesis
LGNSHTGVPGKYDSSPRNLLDPLDPFAACSTMQTISAYILAYNEAEKLKAAAESVLWADEIVVVDSNSTDVTAEIAAALGARVVQVAFQGFGELRNRAIEACRCDWIFSLDAD